MNFFPRHFLLRRLHSLFGILSLGIFLTLHLFFYTLSESSLVIPFLLATGAILILYFGLELLDFFQTQFNIHQYPFSDNWRFVFQKISGMISLLFVFLSCLKWVFILSGFHLSFFSWITLSSGFDWIDVIGIFFFLFYFWNALWSFLIDWGVTVSSASQRVSLFLCLLLFAIHSFVQAYVIFG